MGVSKVDFAGKTLVDLTSDTVNEQSLLSGYTAHNRAGELIEGLAVIPTKLSQLENDAGYAKTESPAFTGTPTAPTPPDNTNSTQIATTAYVKTLIANLVNGAPETLDTLKEIADALGENDDAVQALNAAIGNKVDKVADKGLSTNDFTTAEKNKLAGIANNANNYSLPLASSTVRGGVKVGYAENGKNYPVELSNEQMFVNVPWTDNNTWKANTASSDGYVAKGSGQANKVWKTDANGVPGWRADANTTYANMAGATESTAGKSGLVPAPKAGDNEKYLCGNGSFNFPPGMQLDIENSIDLNSSSFPFVPSKNGIICIRCLSNNQNASSIILRQNGKILDGDQKNFFSYLYANSFVEKGFSVDISLNNCAFNSGTFIPTKPLIEDGGYASSYAYFAPGYEQSLDIEIGETQTINYTVQEDGYIFLGGYGGANSFVSFSCGKVSQIQQATSNEYICLQVPVSRNTTCILRTNNIKNNRNAIFVPAVYKKIGITKDIPLVKSLTVTQEGVSALDGVVGKTINDKIDKYNNFLSCLKLISQEEVENSESWIEYTSEEDSYYQIVAHTGTTSGTVSIQIAFGQNREVTFYTFSDRNYREYWSKTSPIFFLKNGEKVNFFHYSSTGKVILKKYKLS